MNALKGKEFEKLILFRAEKLEQFEILTLGRYGVQVSLINGVWQPIPSLPDFEGVEFTTGRQIIIEAKVCSQASYPIYSTDKSRPRQLEHMLKRSTFSAMCYLMIHFNERKLVTKTEEARTVAFEVNEKHDFWRQYRAGEVRSITRQDCDNYGIDIPWNLYSPRATTKTPDLAVLLK